MSSQKCIFLSYRIGTNKQNKTDCPVTSGSILVEPLGFKSKLEFYIHIFYGKNGKKNSKYQDSQQDVGAIHNTSIYLIERIKSRIG